MNSTKDLPELQDKSTLPRFLRHVPSDLLTKGYSVIPSLVSESECKDAIQMIWTFIEDTSGGVVKRIDSHTWYPDGELVHSLEENTDYDENNSGRCNDNIHTLDGDKKEGLNKVVEDPFPHSGSCLYSDRFQSLGAGFVLNAIHEILAERLFEPLYGTRELHTSKEGFTLYRPIFVNITNDEDGHHTQKSFRWKRRRHHKKEKIIDSPETYDHDNQAEDVCTIQSQVILTHPGHSDGYISVCTHSSTEGKGQHSTNIEVPLKVKAGDVVIFRSHLARIITRRPQKTFHAIAHCSMGPANLTPEYPNIWIQKINAYKWGKTGDHRHYAESWYNHERNNSCDITQDEEGTINWILERQRPFYRYSPPNVTNRLAELYGLLPYSVQSKEQHEYEVKRAIIRGVRFVDSVDRPQIKPIPALCDARLKNIRLGGNETLLGQDKYLGGVNSLCGRYIYGVPGTAKRVLRINTQTDEMDMIGPAFSGQFKWLRGVEVPVDVMGEKKDEYPYGCCLCLPCNAPSVLKINPATNEVKSFGDIDEHGWLYHGGDIGSDGYVYAIPANATRVAKIDPRNETIELIGPSFPGVQKWFGGILASDGCIYGIPHNATGLLKIDPVTQLCTVVGEGSLPSGQWKWHGGTAILGGSKIIGYPNNADSVLVFDVNEQRVFMIGDETILKSGRHRIPQDRRYKYLGGAVTKDEKFTFLFPCDAERVLKIDNHTLNISLIGPEFLQGENKYQNGFVSRDGCIYGVPQRASGILRIIPRGSSMLEENSEDYVDVLYCGDDMVTVKDKFEGGVIDQAGNIICIPLRAKYCVKVIPGQDDTPNTNS